MSYWAAETAPESERMRLELLQQRSDPLTFRRLEALGCREGWSCLEVGAGAGSVARWLAIRVESTGRVVATDTDPRFLEGLGAAGIEVRSHDIRTDELENATYDLVHCRGLLCHLDDPQQALRRMVGALRPGGWLLVEQSDYVSLSAACPQHPLADTWNRLIAALGTHRIFDPYLGRLLPGLLGSLGLDRVDHEGTVQVHAGGSPAAEFQRASFTAMCGRLVEDGVVTDAEIALVDAALSDPSFAFIDPIAFAAWGVQPPP